MNNKDGTLSKIVSFAEDKGFYIILMLCVIAIGISGYVLFFLPDGGETSDVLPDALEPGLPSANQTEPDHTPVIPDVDVRLEQDYKPTVPDTPAQPEPEVKAESKPEQDDAQETWLFKKDPEYLWPVSGEVIKEFSIDKLIYDKTMDDWRTHNGIDVSCSTGDEVKAIAAGTVRTVYADELLGTVVIIDHESGVSSMYCGLAQNETMADGMKVEAGQTIGTVGGTMKSESLMEPHLHLSVMKDGDYIDPAGLNMK